MIKDPAQTMQIGDTNAVIPVAGSAAKQAFFEKLLATPRAPAR